MSKYPEMLRDLVLVKIKKETTTKTGIEMPKDVVEERKMAASRGEAVVCGKDCEEVKVGDTVMVKGYVGNELEDESFDEDYWFRVIAETDIMAYYRKGEK